MLHVSWYLAISVLYDYVANYILMDGYVYLLRVEKVSASVTETNSMSMSEDKGDATGFLIPISIPIFEKDTVQAQGVLLGNCYSTL